MMESFAYQGDHAEVTLYGVAFPRGVFVPVDDSFLIAKLKGNSHFEQGGAPVVSDPDETPIVEAPPPRRGRKPKEV